MLPDKQHNNAVWLSAEQYYTALLCCLLPTAQQLPDSIIMLPDKQHNNAVWLSAGPIFYRQHNNAVVE
jgi:hypothetical protein